eukprot:symbB.v1.2.006757.t1/scaffold405.1/size210896/13
MKVNRAKKTVPQVEEISLKDLFHLTGSSTPNNGLWRRSLKDYTQRFQTKVQVHLEGHEPVTVSQSSHSSWEKSDPMTTGGTIWDAALLLSAYLRVTRCQAQRTLELGSGTGLVGLVASRLGAKVTFTDLPGMLPLLEANVKENHVDAEIRPLVWQDAASSWISVGHSYDLVLMSDVLYHAEQYDALLTVLRVLASKRRSKSRFKRCRMRFLWAQELHHPELCQRLQQQLRSEGWRVKHLSTVDDGLGQALCLLRLKPPRRDRFHHRHLWRFCGWKKAPEATTARILELLKGDGGTTRISAERNCSETTLEYRGQWQPKPNGAETGHGVVPQDWAIEVASENDRSLASFGWAGGAQLCLSNAFGETKRLEAQAQDLLDHGCTKDDPAVQCIRAIASASEEREALMRRQWCDIDFQQGEEANQELLKHLERDFAAQLVQTSGRLQNEDIGNWYYIKRCNADPGHVYLGASVGGDGLELNGHDDESGRQRWQLLPEGREDIEDASASWYLLRLSGGTSTGRRLLSRGLGGLELRDFDDGTGRQRWRITGFEGRSALGWRIGSAGESGDPGVGMAKQVEAMSSGRFLSLAMGRLTLEEDGDCWEIGGPSRSFGSNLQAFSEGFQQGKD